MDLITSDLLTHLPSLQIVLTTGTGVSHIDLAACRRRGIAVTNTANVHSQDTADFAVTLLIDIIRKISAGDRFVLRGLRPSAGEYTLSLTLRNKRVGIVGLGHIGSQVATRLEAFGCTISYTGRAKKPSVSYTFYPTACGLASHSDILVICCSLTDNTRHMINDDVMSALGEKGLVVNIARGAVIDEKALVARLMDGRIGGAGLDVFENEPNVPRELAALDNVVLSPHSAAFTEEGFLDAFRMVMSNLEAFFSNKPLISPVLMEHY